MAKKTTPIEKAARMLDLVPFITSHQGISIVELAAEFGITVDELLSDLNSLWMCGDNRFDLIDLQFESGYVTIRNAQTLNLTRSLSQQEIISILIGLDLIEKSLAAQRSDLISELTLLKSKLGGGIARILDATPPHDAQIYSTISAALEMHRKVEISYFSPTEDEVTVRTVIPLELSISDGHEYLTSFCEKVQAERTFRVDRIQSARVLDTKVEPVPHLKNVESLISSTVTISRNLRKSRESLGEYLVGDGAVVSVTSYNSEWLLRTVISAAGAMEVTSSPEMRSRVADRATQTLKQYR